MTHITRIPTTDNLLARQADATAAFRVTAKALQSAIRLLKFPLGSPSKHHDVDDMLGSIDEWLVPTDERTLEDRAADIVAADRELDGQSRNDARRDLVGEG